VNSYWIRIPNPLIIAVIIIILALVIWRGGGRPPRAG
jgi:hypothetical protein